MTAQEIEDSIYFDGSNLCFTTDSGKHSVPIAAIFDQTAAMMDDRLSDDIRSATNALVIAFEHGVKQLDTLAAGVRK